MNDINLAMAFMQYMADPTPETAEAVVVALEARPDMPIGIEQTRKALIDGIPQVRAASKSTSAAQTTQLLQRLTQRKPS